MAQDMQGLTPVTDPSLIAMLEQPQSKINEASGGGSAAKSPEEMELIRNEALDKIRLARSLKQRSRDGWFTTGIGAGVAGGIGGTGAYDVRQDTETLKNAGALTRIMELSKQSGGKNPLTPLSNSDFQALASSLANLDTSQSDEQFQANIDRVIALYERAYTGAGGASLERELSGEAPTAGKREDDPMAMAAPANQQFGTPTISPDGSSNFTTQRDAEFGAKIQSAFDAGAGKEQLNAIAVSYGFNPYGADLDAAITYRNKGGKGARILPPKSGYEGPTAVGALAATPVGAYFAGAANGLTAGRLDETVGLFGGDAERAQQAKEVMREAYPVADLAGNITGAALGSYGLSRVSGTAPLAADVAYGGLYGSGENNDDRVMGALIGAGTAFAGGKAVDKVGAGISGLRASRAAGRAEREAFRQSAEALGIDYLAADVPGRTGARMASGLSGMTLGGIPLSEAAQKTIATAQAARDRIASGVGAVRDTTGAGQAAQKGANTFIRDSANRADELYSRIPIAADNPAVLNDTRAALAEVTAGLPSNPELSALVSDGRLESYRKALESGGLSWNDLKAFRSYIGEKAGSPSLQSDTSQRSLKRLYAGLSEDMRATAASNGPNALKAFERANSYYRGRQDRIDNVLSEVLGNNLDKSADGAFRRIESLAQAKGGDPIKLARLIRSLPDDEAGQVRATIIDRLGMASAGRQSADGDTFSPAELVTQWNKLSPRAKAVLFQGEHREALDKLLTVADGMKGSTQFANVSKTSLASNALALAGAFWVNPVVALGAAGSQIGAGKLLANPSFAKWLARAPKKPNPAARLAHVNQLTGIARTNPAIAPGAYALQQRLAEAFTQAPMKAAASTGATGEEVQQ